jgi:hypothetical protein
MPEYIGMPHEEMIVQQLLGNPGKYPVCTLQAGMRTLKFTCDVKKAL